MNIIIFGSQYGTAKQYAEVLGRRTDTEVRSYKEKTDIDVYDTIVYIGALYAGGVLGMKETLGRLTHLRGKRIIIATVGLADPTDPQNIESIRRSMCSQLPPEVFATAHIYHLRGGIDYSRLGIKHKTMMRMLYRQVQKIPEEERTAEVRAMIETYDKKVNFVDFNSLDGIVSDLRQGI